MNDYQSMPPPNVLLMETGTQCKQQLFKNVTLNTLYTCLLRKINADFKASYVTAEMYEVQNCAELFFSFPTVISLNFIKIDYHIKVIIFKVFFK